MRELIIAGRVINEDSPAFCVAEVGGNHEGSLVKAKQLITVAAECGCSAVKFQKRDLATWEALNPEAWNRVYDEETVNPEWFGFTYGDHRAFLEFGWDEYRELRRYAHSLGLVFFATAFDLPSLKFLNELGVPAVKLASASIVNEDLIRAAASTHKPVILSTGGATIPEVDAAAMILNAETNFALLQCTATYPTAPEDMNLRVVRTLRGRYPMTIIGVSDHYAGWELAPVAYGFGARIFEKHFTMSRRWKGSDQAFSLEPLAMKTMVESLSIAHRASGDGKKRRLDAEVGALVKMGRVDLVGAVA